MGGSSTGETNPSGTRRLLLEELGAVTDQAGIHEITEKRKAAGCKVRPVGVGVTLVDFVLLGSAESKQNFELKPHTSYATLQSGIPCRISHDSLV